MARIGKLYDDARARLSRVLQTVRREPTGVRPTPPVRIKLGDLPAPLRAVVRDESNDGILIEAELPWLTVGSAVQAEFTDGREKTGRVHWFGVDATRAGSARLRIFVDLSGSAAPAGPRLPDVGELGRRRRRWPWVAIAAAILVAAASSLAYLLLHRPPPPPLLPSPVAAEPAPPRAPAAVAVPKEPPAAPPAVAAPAPAQAQATHKQAPARPKPKRKRR